MVLPGAVCAALLIANPRYLPAQKLKVQEGQSFTQIAVEYGISGTQFHFANHGQSPESVRPGMTIMVPARFAKAHPEDGLILTGYGKTKKKAPTSSHKVQAGDNDWKIASKHGITVKQLHALNSGVNWNKLKPGQSLNVGASKSASKTAPKAPAKPAAKPASKAPAKTASKKSPAVNVSNSKTTTTSYKVTDSDNDWKIAAKFGMTPAAVRAMNPGVNWSKLRPGMTVKVKAPAKKAAMTTATIKTKRVAINKDDVVVRSSGKITGTKMRTVQRGTMASVVDRVNDWYKLKFDYGFTGWVRGDMLKAITAKDSVKIKPTIVATNSPKPKSNSTTPTKSSKPVGIPSNIVASLKPGVATSLINTACTFLGTRYRWGGTSRGGVDCSGFTTLVFRSHGISLPRTANEQSRVGMAVERGEWKTGDLIFFRTGRSSRINHVGIYVGNGTFMHASSGGGRVMYSNLKEGYYSQKYAAARRIAGGHEHEIAIPAASEKIVASSSREKLPAVGSGKKRKSPSPATEVAKSEKSDKDAMKAAEKELSGSDTLPGPAPEPVSRPSRVQQGTDVTGK